MTHRQQDEKVAFSLHGGFVAMNLGLVCWTSNGGMTFWTFEVWLIFGTVCREATAAVGTTLVNLVPRLRIFQGTSKVPP